MAGQSRGFGAILTTGDGASCPADCPPVKPTRLSLPGAEMRNAAISAAALRGVQRELVRSERSSERRQDRDVEGALDEPDACDRRNERRPAGEHDAAIRPCPAKPERGRQEGADDRELSQLDADVESEQRQRERSGREAEITQRAGMSPLADVVCVLTPPTAMATRQRPAQRVSM